MARAILESEEQSTGAILILDLVVDPNKSTWVDLRNSPGAVDWKSNLELQKWL